MLIRLILILSLSYANFSYAACDETSQGPGAVFLSFLNANDVWAIYQTHPADQQMIRCLDLKSRSGILKHSNDLGCFKSLLKLIHSTNPDDWLDSFHSVQAHSKKTLGNLKSKYLTLVQLASLSERWRSEIARVIEKEKLEPKAFQLDLESTSENLGQMKFSEFVSLFGNIREIRARGRNRILLNGLVRVEPTGLFLSEEGFYSIPEVFYPHEALFRAP